LLLMSLVVCIVPVLPTSFSLERLAIGVITSGLTLAVTGCFAWWYSGKQRALRQLRIEAKAEEMIRRFDRSASKD
jgi:VIT1/CCC1 family predicted Fe2+/Mn2+ transporter